MRGATLWSMLLLPVVFTGCASGPSSPQPLGLDAEITRGGTIIGFVRNTEVAPLIGAIVGIPDGASTTTDVEGRFVLTRLPPGTHQVQVQALGYLPAQRGVEVSEFEPVEVQFVLEPMPIEMPYIEVLIFKGYSQCDYMLWVLSGRVGAPCDTGQAKSMFKVDVKATWEFHVTEMKWTGGIGNYDSFRLFTADDGGCESANPCYGMVYGRGYARLEGEPGKTELVRHYDPWLDERGPPYPENGSFPMVVNGQWVGMFQQELSGPVCQEVLKAGTGSGNKPGCLGVGVSTGIPYDLYVSIFHSQQPEGRGPCCPATRYTALPDQ